MAREPVDPANRGRPHRTGASGTTASQHHHGERPQRGADENVYFPFAPTPARVDPPYETFQFVVHGPQAADNGSLTVHIDWADAANDWDLYVYKDDVPAVTGTTETWSFTCRTPSGATASSDVLVQRGESVDLGVACPS